VCRRPDGVVHEVIAPENERCHDGGCKTFGATDSHGGNRPHDQPSQCPGQPAEHDPAGDGHERDAQGFRLKGLPEDTEVFQVTTSVAN
jgi:hypothetical protein